ncbi:hypothetical protein [Caudoviricetes sp.]|nr:hypothetical protein [Caudoviricetes sp.]
MRKKSPTPHYAHRVVQTLTKKISETPCDLCKIRVAAKNCVLCPRCTQRKDLIRRISEART